MKSGHNEITRNVNILNSLNFLEHFKSFTVDRFIGKLVHISRTPTQHDLTNTHYSYTRMAALQQELIHETWPWCALICIRWLGGTAIVLLCYSTRTDINLLLVTWFTMSQPKGTKSPRGANSDVAQLLQGISWILRQYYSGVYNGRLQCHIYKIARCGYNWRNIYLDIQKISTCYHHEKDSW